MGSYPSMFFSHSKNKHPWVRIITRIHSDSIYMTFKNRQNQSMRTKVRTLIISREV